MASKTNLTIISSHDVDAAPEGYYNPSLLTSEEALGFDRPSEAPLMYTRWLPLILHTRNIPLSSIQTIVLKHSQAQLLYDASYSTICTGVLNRSLREDIEEEIYPSFEKVVFPPKGLFMRLDACSPKDASGSLKPLSSIEEIVLRLASSQWARNTIFNFLEEEEGRLNIFLVPYDKTMKAENEFRVFCAPGKGITAVSQYRWFKPSIFQGRSRSEIEETVEKIMEEVRKIYSLIMKTVDERNDELDKLLFEQGFSFDVMWREDKGSCALIELNGFGASTNVGTCLFHWVRDLNVLYGNRTERGVEFRISLSEPLVDDSPAAEDLSV